MTRRKLLVLAAAPAATSDTDEPFDHPEWNTMARLSKLLVNSTDADPRKRERDVRRLVAMGQRIFCRQGRVA